MITEISLQDNILYLSGELNYQTGVILRSRGRDLLIKSPQNNLILDCSRVERSSSVGIALLLAWLRDAKQCNKELKINCLPYCMRQIAEVFNVLDVLER